MITRIRRWLDLLCGPAPLVPGLWLFGSARRSTLLDALRDAICYRAASAYCRDCEQLAGGEICPDCTAGLMTACGYEDLYKRLQDQPRRRSVERLLSDAALEDAMVRAQASHAAREAR